MQGVPYDVEASRDQVQDQGIHLGEQSSRKHRIIDGFLSGIPEEAVRWVLDEAHALELDDAKVDRTALFHLAGEFKSSTLLRKQDVLTTIVRGFVGLPASQRAEVTRMLIPLLSYSEEFREHAEAARTLSVAENIGFENLDQDQVEALQRAHEAGISAEKRPPLVDNFGKILIEADIFGATNDEFESSAQAVKIAAMEHGILSLCGVSAELVAELKEEERSEILKHVPDDQAWLCGRMIMPGGYVDQLLYALKLMVALYYLMPVFALVLIIELTLSFVLGPCSMPMLHWLSADSILWSCALLTAAFVVYCYSSLYSAALTENKEKLQQMLAVPDKSEEDDVPVDEPATESDADEEEPLLRRQRSLDIDDFIEPAALMKVSVAAGLCVLFLLAGFLAGQVVLIELLIAYFGEWSCTSHTFAATTIFCLLRFVASVMLFLCIRHVVTEGLRVMSYEPESPPESEGSQTPPTQGMDDGYGACEPTAMGRRSV